MTPWSALQPECPSEGHFSLLQQFNFMRAQRRNRTTRDYAALAGVLRESGGEAGATVTPMTDNGPGVSGGRGRGPGTEERIGPDCESGVDIGRVGVPGMPHWRT